MTVSLHALPYDQTAPGFYFQNFEDYQVLAAKAVNAYGDHVEEFEIQFIDGEPIDVALARAFDLNQSNVGQFLEAAAEWDGSRKIRFIIAVGEYGQESDPASVDDFDIDIYEIGIMRELAERFIDEGLFGEIPSHLEGYIDYDAVARDLSVDFSQAEIAGINYVFRVA